MVRRGWWLGIALVFGCRIEVGPPQRAAAPDLNDKPRGAVMIYTSMYRSVIDQMKPMLQARLPDVEVRWLQGGSEKLATRLDAELTAQAPQADLILTSDPFWYERLRQEGHLVPYAALRALSIPRALLHPTGAFVTARLSTMVIAYDNRTLTPAEAPKSFEDLFSPKWTGRVTTPDPLGSGTTFTTLAFLTDRYGDAFIDKMQASKTISSGGNTSTLTRIESGEHAVGFVLLENILAARARGAPIGFVVPKDGAIVVPGPIALVKGGPNPRAAKAVYDALLSPELQRAVVDGNMHAPFEDLPVPNEAPPLKDLLTSPFQWSTGFIQRTVDRAPELRRRWADRDATP